MKRLGFLMLLMIGSLLAEDIKIPSYKDIMTGERVDCKDVYIKLQNNEKIDCEYLGGLNETGEDCKCKSLIYKMPGGKGSLDRILGRDPKTGKVAPPRDVSMEEAQMVGAKNTYKEAVKKSEIAKNKLEKAKKSGKGVDKAQEEYDDTIRDVELSKAKIKDLEEIAKENKKEK